MYIFWYFWILEVKVSIGIFCYFLSLYHVTLQIRRIVAASLRYKAQIRGRKKKWERESEIEASRVAVRVVRIIINYFPNVKWKLKWFPFLVLVFIHKIPDSTANVILLGEMSVTCK